MQRTSQGRVRPSPLLRDGESALGPEEAHTNISKALRMYAGNSPGKEGAHPMLQEDQAVAQPEPRGMPGKENPEPADEVYIPDYVMLDFGIPEATSAEVGLKASKNREGLLLL